MRLPAIVLSLAMMSAALADPSTKPADPAVDFLLDAATQPAALPPATQPSEPVLNGPKNDGARPAVLTLSNGQVVKGMAATTLDKPVRVWDETIKDYRDIPFSLIQSATAVVNWERDEPEWTFKESGSDVKIYTGRTYPARETRYTFTLTNGDKITGDVAAPIYMEADGKTKTYVLHKRDKGELGQKLSDLVYVQKIDFSGK